MRAPIDAYVILRTDFGIPLSEIVLYCNLYGIADTERFVFLVKAVEMAAREVKKEAGSKK